MQRTDMTNDGYLRNLFIIILTNLGIKRANETIIFCKGSGRPIQRANAQAIMEILLQTETFSFAKASTIIMWSILDPYND